MKIRGQAGKYLLYFLIAAAVIIILTGINGTRLPPLPSLRPDSPTHDAVFDGGVVLIDRNNSRLLFAREDLKLRRAAGIRASGSPSDVATDLIASGDRIYVTEASRELDGLYFKSESVAEYSTGGRYLRTLYTESYGEDVFVPCPAFLDVKVIDGQILLLAGREDSVDVIDIGAPEPELLRSIPVPHRMYGGELLDDGSMLLWECVGRYYEADVSGSISPIEASKYVNRVEKLFGIEDVTGDLALPSSAPKLSWFSLKRNSAGEPAYFFYTDYESLRRYGFSTREDSSLSSLRLSFALFAYNLAFWLSALFLASLLIIRLSAYVRRSGSAAKAKTVCIILLISAGVSAFYTVQSFRQLRAGYESRLLTQVRQMQQILDRDFPGIVA